MCCGWLSAEAPEIARFSPRPRLCSLFGLRVGAAGGFLNSMTYARGFVVNGARDALSITKNRHPVLRALAFERKDVCLVVTDVVKQLLPDWSSLFEALAPQGF